MALRNAWRTMLADSRRTPLCCAEILLCFGKLCVRKLIDSFCLNCLDASFFTCLWEIRQQTSCKLQTSVTTS